MFVSKGQAVLKKIRSYRNVEQRQFDTGVVVQWDLRTQTNEIFFR